MSRIGIMGGTFDPIHIGHLLAAEVAREGCGLDEVWFIPTADPPLKAQQPKVDAASRYRMVEAAISSHPQFHAQDIELIRGGTSYSIDTVLQLTERSPEAEFSYIIGSDRINDLPSWHRIEELARLCRFIGLERGGVEMELNSLPAYLAERVTIVSMPAVAISSTMLREKLRTGSSVRYCVPEPVRELIESEGFYG